MARERVRDSLRAEQIGIEKVGGQTDVGPGGVTGVSVLAIVALALDGVIEQAVAEPEGDGGEFGGDGGIDAGVITGVAGHGAGPEQVGQVGVVGNRLVLSDIELAGLLVELLIAPVGMGARQEGSEAIM